jgi:hypothetical protein
MIKMVAISMIIAGCKSMVWIKAGGWQPKGCHPKPGHKEKRRG